MNICVKILVISFLFSLAAFPAGKISLAVSDLAARGINESEAAVISEQLRVEFTRAEQIRLIERSQMKEILKEQGFQQSGCTNEECAVEVGQLLGVKNIVIGSIGMAGSYTVLAVRIIDVGTGEIVVNKSVRTRGGIDKVLETGVREAADMLQKELLPKRENPDRPVLKKALLIGGGGAVLIGGAITAYFMFNEKDDSESNPQENMEIKLP